GRFCKRPDPRQPVLTGARRCGAWTCTTMTDPGRGPFHDALLLYEEAALPELGALGTMDTVRLIELVERHIPDGVFAATRPDLESALQQVLAQEERTDSTLSLESELGRFLDLAFAHGLIARHPLSGEARVEAVVARSDLPSREEVAAVLARLVANVLEEAVSSGLFFARLTVPVSEIGEEGGVLDQTAEHLSLRWRGLTHRLRGPLDLLRIGLPIVALVLALNSFFSCSGPLGSRTQSALITGSAVKELRIMTYNRLIRGDKATIDSMEELAKRAGVAKLRSAKVFRLRKVVGNDLFLEHIETDSLVIISDGYVCSFVHGTWRMTE
ncbi:MAG: hypothetical protein K8R59_08205, partial [Thermoanaerobaculales bacterium]|nr:hypothetical protein [Thermoanaerobaculales bacterium]